ncbi:hypothetical protein BKA69DRAFT_1058048 [Paraphysoderma sedebokerense]|nr:hypothetical protein BKA69DRAFT_1058048 [Paraphysoderma sedebokerense]
MSFFQVVLAVSLVTCLTSFCPTEAAPVDAFSGSYVSCRNPGDIAITYDDGPDAVLTNQLLDTLSQLGIRTTFFVVGQRLQNPAQAAALRRAYSEGHDIASHTYTHTSLPSLSESQIRQELLQTEAVIYSIIGERPRFFRPPYGNFDAKVLSVSRSLGYTPVLWNLDSQDFEHPGDFSAVMSAYTTAFSQHSAHSYIALNHDIQAVSVQNAPKLYQYVTSQGFRPVPLSQCVGMSVYRA